MSIHGDKTLMAMDIRVLVQSIESDTSDIVRRRSGVVAQKVRDSISVSGRDNPHPGALRSYFHSFLREYVTSAWPGDPPHKQSGRLLSSIYSVLGKSSDTHIAYKVGSTSPYARALEFGSASGAHQHPFLRPALEGTSRAMVRSLKRRLAYRFKKREHIRRRDTNASAFRNI